MASLVRYDSDENIVGAADPARAWHEGPVEASALEGKGPCTVHVFLFGSDLSIAPTKKHLYKKHIAGLFGPESKGSNSEPWFLGSLG